MMFGRQICASLMTALLALSPVTHALAGSHQHDAAREAHMETASSAGHHDHNAHDHGVSVISEAVASADKSNPDSDSEDDAQACCHSSGGVCTFLISTAEDAASQVKCHGGVIERAEADPHQSHLVPTAPPPRGLG